MLWYLLTGAVVTGAVQLIRQTTRLSYEALTIWHYVFLLVLVIGGTIALVRRTPTRLWWEVLLTLCVFLGVWYVCVSLFPQAWGSLIASGLTLTYLLMPIVFFQNVFYLFGVTGIAINFAGWISPELLLVGLVVCVLYDIVAGPPEGHAQMLSELLRGRLPTPGIAVFQPIPEPSGKSFTGTSSLWILGVVDLVLPMSLVGRAAFAGVGPALVVLGGALCAAVLLARDHLSHPRAVLPMLAVGVALPFIFMRLFSIV